MSKMIPLTRGYFATVDDADFEWLNQWKWCVSLMGRPGRKKPYAVRGVVEDGRSRTIVMHRVIAGAGEGETTDHKDSDGLNNRRANLRVCTQAKNALNRAGNQVGRKTSKYKGVYWQKDINRWRARFRLAYLGTFKCEEEAARAYDAAALAYDSEYSYLNFGHGRSSSLES